MNTIPPASDSGPATGDSHCWPAPGETAPEGMSRRQTPPVANPRVALVCMPWAGAGRAAIGLSILKRALRRRRIPADIHYLNLRLAKQMGLADYDRMTRYYLVGDWLFARHLFGEPGAGESANSRAAIESREGRPAKDFFDALGLDLDRLESEAIPRFLAECLAEIPWERYAVIGFSSVFVQQVASLLLARRIKRRHPGVRIVFGGINVSGAMGRETLRAFDWVDYVVEGEADESFPELVAGILAGGPEAIPAGVAGRHGDGVVSALPAAPVEDWARIPIPDFTEYYDQLRAAGLDRQISPPVPFESARGCRWGERTPCAFCSLGPEVARYRPKPARRVLRELRAQARRYESLNFEATDNMAGPDHFTGLFPRLAESGLDFRLFYDLRATLNRDQAELLWRAGVRRVEIGIESLHTGILKRLGKGVTALQNLQTLKWCAWQGIAVDWYLLFGCPGESPEDYREMRETILRTLHLPPPAGLHRVGLERLSPYFRDPARWGLAEIAPKWLYRYIYPPDRVRLEEIAFHFDFTWRGAGEDPAAYIGPVRALVEEWQRRFAQRPVRFVSRRGPGFTELLDSRPLDGKSSEPSRKILLTGSRHQVYGQCETARTPREIAARLTPEGGTPMDESTVREVLRGLDAERLVFTENDRYLSLAVPLL